MKKYNVKPEYQEKWFWDQYPEPLDEKEVHRLAAEWGLTEEDLEEQLEDYEAQKEEVKKMKKYNLNTLYNVAKKTAAEYDDTPNRLSRDQDRRFYQALRAGVIDDCIADYRAAGGKRDIERFRRARPDTSDIKFSTAGRNE